MRVLIVVAVCLPLAACGSAGETDAAATEVYGPTSECEFAIGCAEVADPEHASLFSLAYGEGAECWNDPTTALACVRACEVETQAFRAANPTVRECWEGGAPPRGNSSLERLGTSNQWRHVCNRKNSGSIQRTRVQNSS